MDAPEDCFAGLLGAAHADAAADDDRRLDPAGGVRVPLGELAEEDADERLGGLGLRGVDLGDPFRDAVPLVGDERAFLGPTLVSGHFSVPSGVGMSAVWRSFLSMLSIIL